MSEQAVFDALKYHIEVDMRGTRWYRNSMGQLHRDYGPAVEYSNGDELWYHNDQLHRENGPAIVCTNGHKEWWQNGQRHRTDGAAVELSDGDKWWFINGVRLTEAEFNQAIKSL